MSSWKSNSSGGGGGSGSGGGGGFHRYNRHVEEGEIGEEEGEIVNSPRAGGSMSRYSTMGDTPSYQQQQQQHRSSFRADPVQSSSSFNYRNRSTPPPPPPPPPASAGGGGARPPFQQQRGSFGRSSSFENRGLRREDSSGRGSFTGSGPPSRGNRFGGLQRSLTEESNSSTFSRSNSFGGAGTAASPGGSFTSRSAANNDPSITTTTEAPRRFSSYSSLAEAPPPPLPSSNQRTTSSSYGPLDSSSQGVPLPEGPPPSQQQKQQQQRRSTWHVPPQPPPSHVRQERSSPTRRRSAHSYGGGGPPPPLAPPPLPQGGPPPPSLQRPPPPPLPTSDKPPEKSPYRSMSVMDRTSIFRSNKPTAKLGSFADMDTTSSQSKPVQQQPPKAARVEKPQSSPLTVAKLGSRETVERAEKAVELLGQFVDFNAEVLPTKNTILKALAGIETKLKTQSDQMEELQVSHQACVEKEAQEAKEAERKRQEHLQKLEMERQRKEQQAELEEMEQVMETKRAARRQEQQEALQQLELQVKQVHKVETRRIANDASSPVSEQLLLIQGEIDQVQQALAKTQRSATKAVSRAEKLHQQYLAKQAVPDLDDPGQSIVASIMAQNRLKAQEAQQVMLDELIPVYSDFDAQVRQVTSKANALYTEPCQNPMFEHHALTHEEIRPLVVQRVDQSERRLHQRWEELAEEYVVRNDLYQKQQHHVTRKQHHKAAVRTSIMGPKKPAAEEAGRGGSSTGGNPYRRARRGISTPGGSDVVRSEYEQDQIIAEITAKEAMEKRIAHGGSKLPRQVTQVEKDLTATYINTFRSQRVFDPLEEAEINQHVTNSWTDMEKCIFLDRFLQHPKDFRKIASFLRNKTTKDCVKFYYNSKQSVPYKAALKEHNMRRKRRGEYPHWDATVQAALSVGARVTAGASEDKPLMIELPEHDNTFVTYQFHPMRRELYDALLGQNEDDDVEVKQCSPAEDEQQQLQTKRKRNHNFGTLCVLDETERKYLKRCASDLSMLRRSASSDMDTGTSEVESGAKNETTPRSARKAPQKWTAQEKTLFFNAVEQHGKDWKALEAAIGTKSVSQIKNFWYDYNKKRLLGKHKSECNSTDETVKTSNKGKKQQEAEAAKNVAQVVPSEPISQESAMIQQHLEQQGDPQGQQANMMTAAEAWAQTEIMKQHQAVAAAAEARRMIQQHHHQQQQQQQQQVNLASLIPWLSPSQITQLATLQQQQQQHQQQQQQQQHQDGSGAFSRELLEAQIHWLRQQAGHHHMTNVMQNASQLHSLAALPQFAAALGSSTASALQQQLVEAAAVNAPAAAPPQQEELRPVLHGFGNAAHDGTFHQAADHSALGLLAAQHNAQQQQQHQHHQQRGDPNNNHHGYNQDGNRNGN